MCSPASASGDVLNTQEHQFWVTSDVWPPTCLIRQLCGVEPRPDVIIRLPDVGQTLIDQTCQTPRRPDVQTSRRCQTPQVPVPRAYDVQARPG
eukprot:7041039-Prymnesium_polylepis.1